MGYSSRLSPFLVGLSEGLKVAYRCLRPAAQVLPGNNNQLCGIWGRQHGSLHLSLESLVTELGTQAGDLRTDTLGTRCLSQR